MPKRRDIFTLRDLTATDIPLLQSILTESFPAIQKMFGVPEAKISAYFHYQPTYYHLHVHFVHTEKQSVDTRDCIPLEQVIFNL